MHGIEASTDLHIKRIPQAADRHLRDYFLNLGSFPSYVGKHRDLEFYDFLTAAQIVCIPAHKDSLISTGLTIGILERSGIVLDVLDDDTFIRTGDIECPRCREQPSFAPVAYIGVVSSCKSNVLVWLPLPLLIW